MINKNLIKVAKSVENKKVSNTNKKITEKVQKVAQEVKKTLSPEEERDIKAKEKVSQLLEGVDLSIKKSEEIGLSTTSSEKRNDLEWLEEQVSRLTEENDKLKSEAQFAKEDYQKIFLAFQELKSGGVVKNEGDVKVKVVELFNELQDNYMSLRENFYIHPPSFIERMIKFFPFLQNVKKY